MCMEWCIYFQWFGLQACSTNDTWKSFEFPDWLLFFNSRLITTTSTQGHREPCYAVGNFFPMSDIYATKEIKRGGDETMS